jgi:polar amino acid transport system substrate-binding protein
MNQAVLKALAPKGVLRVGLNLSNFLLVSGKTADGAFTGISPDIGQCIADELGVPCRLVPFDSPGALTDAADQDLWDIGNIAVEPERAQSIDFSAPYTLIEANYLVWADAKFASNADVDATGVSIAAYGRSAYDLWLTDNLNNAEMVRSSSIGQSHEEFKNGKADVLASLKPKLLEEVAASDLYRIIEPPFTAIKQAVGVRKGNKEALIFINDLIAKLLKDGFVAAALKKHGVSEKLGIPAID